MATFRKEQERPQEQKKTKRRRHNARARTNIYLNYIVPESSKHAPPQDLLGVELAAVDAPTDAGKTRLFRDQLVGLSFTAQGVRASDLKGNKDSFGLMTTTNELLKTLL